MKILEKKLNIVFYLNEDLKAIRFYDGEKVLCLYPVYVRVTYNRITTRFVYGNVWYPLIKSHHINQDPFFLKQKNLIEMFVQEEIDMYGDKYRITGIGSRFDCIHLGA